MRGIRVLGEGRLLYSVCTQTHHSSPQFFPNVHWTLKCPSTWGPLYDPGLISSQTTHSYWPLNSIFYKLQSILRWFPRSQTHPPLSRWVQATNSISRLCFSLPLDPWLMDSTLLLLALFLVYHRFWTISIWTRLALMLILKGLVLWLEVCCPFYFDAKSRYCILTFYEQPQMGYLPEAVS